MVYHVPGPDLSVSKKPLVYLVPTIILQGRYYYHPISYNRKAKHRDIKYELLSSKQEFRVRPLTWSELFVSQYVVGKVHWPWDSDSSGLRWIPTPGSVTNQLVYVVKFPDVSKLNYLPSPKWSHWGLGFQHIKFFFGWGRGGGHNSVQSKVFIQTVADLIVLKSKSE